MIDLETAKKLAVEFLQSKNCRSNDDHLVILEEHTVEKEYGWIFFYDWKYWLETRDYRYKALGNVPIVVEKYDGSIHSLKILHSSMQENIKEYEAMRGKPDYDPLYFFLRAYMSDTDIGGFSTSKDAIIYYLSYAKQSDVCEVLNLGRLCLQEKSFPWMKIGNLTQRSFQNPDTARKWLAELIQILELELGSIPLTGTLAKVRNQSTQ